MNDRNLLNRREALAALGGSLASGALHFGSSLHAAHMPRTGLGLVIYTLGIRRQRMRKADPGHELFEPFTFLDYCRALGAGGIQVPLGTLAPDACERLRLKAEQFGMYLEGIVDLPFQDADVERFEAEMRTASRVGARAVRCVMIPGRRYEKYKSLREFRDYAERGRQALKRAVPIVERHQVRLAVENHKDQRLDERLALLRQIGSPFVGACVDTGNSLALLDDPLAVVEALAPLAFSVHLKDQAVREYRHGFLLADVALGDGCLDLKRMVEVLRGARPEVRFSLETITREPLQVPCFAESYWLTLGDVPAKDLARTLSMVRKCSSTELVRVSSLSPEEQAEVELATIRKSLRYAVTELRL